MIVMVISLALDGGTSKFSKFCNTNALQFLGKISMSLYLVHYLIIQYFCLLLKHVAPGLLNMTDYRHKIIHGGTNPWFGIFIMVPMSLFAACVLERFMEAPCREILRSKTKITDEYVQIGKTSSNARTAMDCILLNIQNFAIDVRAFEL